LHGCETLYLSVWKVTENNTVLRETSGSDTKLSEQFRLLHNKELPHLYRALSIARANRQEMHTEFWWRNLSVHAPLPSPLHCHH